MLTELHIENFAIIESLEIQLERGLVVFTGETGAGKSIIVDAIETILGGRADPTMIRSGAEKANVEAVFRMDEAIREPLTVILNREGLLEEPDYLTLGREVRLNGRNIARVNGRSVNAALLRELGELLVDVHGQSEHLSLLRLSQHLVLLDRYIMTEAGNPLKAQLERYQGIYQRLKALEAELEELRQYEREASRLSDILTYQINEIEAAHLQAGEEDGLLEERTRLANAEGLASLAHEALLVLDEGGPDTAATSDLLGQAIHALSGLVRIDASQKPLFEQAQVISENLSELTRQLRRYLEGIEFNPRRLDQVEERLALIHSLKRKYGGTISEVLQFAVRAKEQFESITHASEKVKELETEREHLLTRLAQEGESISQTRHSAAQRLVKAIENELNDLHMPGARFAVNFEQTPDPQGVLLSTGERVAYYSTGLERIEFLIAPNPGEGFKPLVKIASGGETSRLMLALKNVLVKADHVPALIFDEIDQGIGGRVGMIVGQKLWQLSRQHQVFCITHLPQLAAFGSQHYHVAKNVQGGRTLTQVKRLEGQERVLELAQMLGSQSDGALQSAFEMLQSAQEKKAQV